MADDQRRKQWRGLSELLDDPELVAIAAQEFPPGADLPPEDTSLSRRHFMTLLGASMALAGAPGCSRTIGVQEIVPYADQPRGVTPSVPRFYATAMPLDGYAFGLLVESHEGRPTKIEGHPEHPATLGGSNVLLQASVLGLYDPNRAKEILKDNAPASWAAFLRAMTAPAPDGKEVHLLLEPTSSPLIGELLDKLRRALPSVRVHYWSPLAKTSTWEGARIAFGKPLEPMYDVHAADVIVALDSDFLCGTNEPLSYARAFADRRRDPKSGMNRLYVIEPSSTITGIAADHRLRVKARDVRAMAAGLLDAVRGGKNGDGWIAACARDLRANAGKSLVIVGDEQPPEVHAIAHAINDALGNAGKTVRCIDPVILDAGAPSHGLDALTAAIDAGRVDKLFILGGNPVYTAFADLDFAAKVRSVASTAYLGLYFNETARACRWFVPEAHYLESWGDARAFDGTVSLMQPLVEPLYGGRTASEVLGALLGDPKANARALLQDSWRGKAPKDTSFDDFWRESLRRGMVKDTAAPPAVARLDTAAVTKAIASAPPPPSGDLELHLREDVRVYDGRFANNAWLLELADPVTKLTWDNAALVSPSTARRLALESEDVVSLTMNGKTVRAPVLVLPGHPDDTVSLAVGYGRAGDEALARGVGVDAFVLRTRAAPWFGDVTLKKTGQTYPLALTQEHWRMDGRETVMHRTLDEYRKDPDFTREKKKAQETLYQLRPPAKNQWAMTIDVNACTGCSACVVACYAENNIPVVGKGGVRKSREMNWIRVDRYYEGSADDPEAFVQPMLCQHCEKAPCEYVCPVNATVHSDDGLNLQVYNRCVGTRFCSNNCPYKVRRFNWFNYNRDLPESVALQKNPDVTVRERGVMEKCTFCVQRIREAEIAARRERREIKDGEIQTACQQACPTRAITFGSIGDENSDVSKKWRVDRQYAVLNELGTQPRVRYLARIRNLNPEIGEK